jgi:endonuclease YncB( thermonuclease family)
VSSNAQPRIFIDTCTTETCRPNLLHTQPGRPVRFISAAQLRRGSFERSGDGFAWRCPQYDKPGEFTTAEANAREHRRGLWADPNPVPPWEWRREKWRAARPM